MPVYAATHTVRFTGPSYTSGTDIEIVLDPPTGNVSSDIGSISDGGDDIWTNNETVSEVANSTVFFISDATYVGTITVTGFGDYPVFEQLGFYTAVFANHTSGTGFNAATQAVADGVITNFTIDSSASFPACFAAGTLIATPSGETAVEALKSGDAVLTADGRAEKVVWVGQQDLFPTNVTPQMQPVRIRAGALGDNLPASDLILTGDHALYLDGYLVNASALVNGDTIDFVPLSECDFRLTVYHIETEAHEVIIANGLPAESYLDQPSRACFNNFDDYAATIGTERRIAEMPVPRIAAPRMLPAAIRARIATDPAPTRAGRPLQQSA